MSWALSDAGLDALDARLAKLRPRLAVEAGSGRSTEILGRYAGRTISLEHHPKFAAETLARLTVDSRVELRRAPLVPFDTVGGRYPWYYTDLPRGIEFALIDGPPGESVGREAAGFAIFPHLGAGAEVWLDDADREHERGCLDLWRKHWRIETAPVLPSGSLLRLRVYRL